MPTLSLFGADPALAQQRRDAFHSGSRAVAPAALATGVWGLVTGVAMVKAGLTTLQALGMSLLVYAGSAQLAALPLISAAAPVWIILLTATVINLRFLIFSAALLPYFRRHSPLRRLLLGYAATDVGFAVFVSRYADVPASERGSTAHLWFFLGMAARIWIAWQGLSIVGILLAGQIPGDWGLEFAAALGLIALTIPMITNRPAFVGAVAAALVAIAAVELPLRLGLLAAVVIGIVAAMGAELLLERQGVRT